MKIFSMLILLTLVVSCTSSKKYDDNMVISNTHKLAAKTIGDGEISVVFEAGLGNGAKTWMGTGILKDVSPFAQVIVYNRAGYRPSEDSDQPATMENKIEDLNSVIHTKSEGRKVILVGHSLGGSIIRAYATKYPDKVSGLVFVDTQKSIFTTELNPEELALAVQNREDESMKGVSLLRNDHPIVKESEQHAEDFFYRQNLGVLPDVPVIAISSLKDYEQIEDETVREELIEIAILEDKALGIGITDFTHKYAPESGHYIQDDSPELITESILAIIEKITL